MDLNQSGFDQHVATAVLDPVLSLGTPELTLFPVTDIFSKLHDLAAGYVTRVTAPNGEEYTVYVAHYLEGGQPAWQFACGSKFHEHGEHSLTSAEACARCKTATEYLPNASDLISRMMSQFQRYQRSAPCFAQWRREKKACAHMQSVLAHLRDNVPEFRDRMRELLAQATGPHPAAC